jgi:hypothetical protein
VAAAEGRPPERNPPGVDLVEAARVGERRRPVGELALDVEQLARLAATVAELPIGERERGDPGVREAAGKGLQPVLPGRAETVAEDHERWPLGVGHEQPPAALVAGRGEGDVASRALSRGHSRHASRKARASATKSPWYWKTPPCPASG